MEIRLARQEDREQLIQLYYNLLVYLDAFEHEVVPSLENATWFVDNLFLPAALRGEPVLIAWDQNQALGALFWPVVRLPYQTRWSYAMGYGTYIDPDKRRLKVGQALRERAVTMLKEQGIEMLFGMVHYANQASVEASDKFGFIPFSRLDKMPL